MRRRSRRLANKKPEVVPEVSDNDKQALAETGKQAISSANETLDQIREQADAIRRETDVVEATEPARFDSIRLLNPIVRTYLDTCRYFGVEPDADLVVFIHFNQPSLRLRRQYMFQMCCCKRFKKINQLGLLPLFFTMIQTADDPEAFSNLQRIELRETYMSAAATRLLAEVSTACDARTCHQQLNYVCMIVGFGEVQIQAQVSDAHQSVKAIRARRRHRAFAPCK